MSARIEITALEQFPLLDAGEPFFPAFEEALGANAFELRDKDVLIVAQKAISKSEDRYVDLSTVAPGDEALRLSGQCQKDPRLVELILRESQAVIRHKPGVIVVRHRLGLVLANAGIDHSNIARDDRQDPVLLLPEDPDRSAAQIREKVRARFGVEIGVVISDSTGRAWRLGTCGICIGCAGIEALSDLRGRDDLYGRPLEVTLVGLGDELAAAASLLMGQADEGRPVVIIRGLDYENRPGGAATLIRPVAEDMFL
jgi:coenzyme F420-0:L-glutamate ligase/coenzyme F420-1:gamma-L-glutamate ligase